MTIDKIMEDGLQKWGTMDEDDWVEQYVIPVHLLIELETWFGREFDSSELDDIDVYLDNRENGDSFRWPNIRKYSVSNVMVELAYNDRLIKWLEEL